MLVTDITIMCCIVFREIAQNCFNAKAQNCSTLRILLFLVKVDALCKMYIDKSIWKLKSNRSYIPVTTCILSCAFLRCYEDCIIHQQCSVFIWNGFPCLVHRFSSHSIRTHQKALHESFHCCIFLVIWQSQADIHSMKCKSIRDCAMFPTSVLHRTDLVYGFVVWPDVLVRIMQK